MSKKVNKNGQPLEASVSTNSTNPTNKENTMKNNNTTTTTINTLGFTLEFQGGTMNVIFDPAWQSFRLNDQYADYAANAVVGRFVPYYQVVTEQYVLHQPLETYALLGLPNNNVGFATGQGLRNLMDENGVTYRKEVLNDLFYRIAFDGNSFYGMKATMDGAGDLLPDWLDHNRKSRGQLLGNVYLERARKAERNLSLTIGTKLAVVKQELYELYLAGDIQGIRDRLNVAAKSSTARKIEKNFQKLQDMEEPEERVTPGGITVMVGDVETPVATLIGKRVQRRFAGTPLVAPLVIKVTADNAVAFAHSTNTLNAVVVVLD